MNTTRKSTKMYYEYEVEHEVEHEETLSTEDYDHAMDHLQGLLENIYNTGSVKDLEFHLEEILHVFGMKMPIGDPKLIKKPTLESVQTDRMLKAWMGYNKTYAEMMTNNKKKLV